MQKNLKDAEVLWIRIPLDGETAERLQNLSDICQSDASRVAASLLHDILKDDDDAHALLEAPAASATIN
jgi:hypothetical protein